MIQLGCCDTTVTENDFNAYADQVGRITRVPLSQVESGVDKIAFQRYVPDPTGAMSVASVQAALKALGFFPGAHVDGICGYRTQSAIRLFQEYVRSVEKLDCLPDGRFGPHTEQHLKRWLDNHQVPNWSTVIANWDSNALDGTEYASWLALLEQVKSRYSSQPNRMLQMVNAFNSTSDTHKVTEWDFSPKHQVHLIGFRGNDFSGKFDDVFVLLIKGLVFKFQGSTDPGASTDPQGTPWLVSGQHDYHFGWHKKTYLALRPQGAGVLVVRAPHNQRLDDAALSNGHLEVNGSINVHWGGRGLSADVSNWSEGCQVITGSVYLNAQDELVDCRAFAGLNQAELNSNPEKTRGAYNVLLDLVTALASDMPADSVKYTLLAEQDLDTDPTLRQQVADAAALIVSLAS